MTYDYELRIKPWRELTLLCDFIDADGLHFGKYFLSFSAFATPSIYYHNSHGHSRFYSKSGEYLGVIPNIIFSLTNKHPIPGDSTEDHY